MSELVVQLLMLVVIGGPAAVIAFSMEVRRAELQPNTRPYTWGLFQGLAGLASGVVLLGIAVIAALFVPASAPETMGLALLMITFYSIPGYFVLKRKRWAWVVLTVASLNPLVWIINGIYGKNRWAEFGARPVSQPAA